MNQTCEADHFEGERRDNFVIYAHDDKKTKAVNSDDEKIKTANKRITLKMSEQTHNDNGQQITPHILKFKFNADFLYPSDNG